MSTESFVKKCRLIRKAVRLPSTVPEVVTESGELLDRAEGVAFCTPSNPGRCAVTERRD